MENAKRIIEINGTKLEVDLREAQTIDSYKVGQPIRVLIKGYGDSYKVFPGVIAAFDNFKDHPSITVAYIETSYKSAELHFDVFNDSTKDIEIAPALDIDISLGKAEVIDFMDRAIEAKGMEIKELRVKKEYFLNKFGQFFKAE